MSDSFPCIRCWLLSFPSTLEVLAKLLEDEEGANEPGSDEGGIILFYAFLTREKNALVRNGAHHEF